MTCCSPSCLMAYSRISFLPSKCSTFLYWPFDSSSCDGRPDQRSVLTLAAFAASTIALPCAISFSLENDSQKSVCVRFKRLGDALVTPKT